MSSKEIDRLKVIQAMADRHLKSPKGYVRDTGRVHAVLGIPSYND